MVGGRAIQNRFRNARRCAVPSMNGTRVSGNMNEKRLCAVLREKPRLEKKEASHAGRPSIDHVLRLLLFSFTAFSRIYYHPQPHRVLEVERRDELDFPFLLKLCGTYLS